MSETWTIESCFNIEGKTAHVRVGDGVQLTVSGEPGLVITRGPQTILDVRISERGTDPPGRNFPRKSGRNHPNSDLYRGALIVLRNQNGCDILHGILGYKNSAGAADDDDTEVFVATKPPAPQ